MYVWRGFREAGIVIVSEVEDVDDVSKSRDGECQPFSLKSYPFSVHRLQERADR